MTRDAMLPVKGLDMYIAAGVGFDDARRAVADLSGVPSRWVFEGNDIETWTKAIEMSEIGWVAWYETGLPDFPFKFDVNLLNDDEPLELARSLGRALDCVVAVPDDGSPDPDDFVLLEPNGTSRPGRIGSL